MRSFGAIAWLLLAALALVIPIRAESAEQQQAQPPAAATAAPLYKPPLRGAPGGRVGGGTRGSEREVFVLSVLAPDHTGLTLNEQPSL